MSKEEFKAFVRNNPILTRHVNSGDMTWQKFYDMYSLYGSKHAVWNDFINPAPTPTPTPAPEPQTSTNNDTRGVTENTTLKDLVGMVKGINLESVRKGIDGVQKTISLIQDFGSGKTKDTYTPRPLYQHLDD